MGSSGNEILDMYIYETNTLLEQLETIVLEAEKADTFSQDDVNEIFRIMHTIKGSSAMMEYDSLATVSHRIEDLFFIIRENTMSVVSVEHRPSYLWIGLAILIINCMVKNIVRFFWGVSLL